MDSFFRLIPYVRPHLRSLIVSWILACVIAVLWGSNFMAAWPIVKTLFEKKTIHEEVAAMIQEAESSVEGYETRIRDLDLEIASIRSNSASDEPIGGVMRRTAERSRKTRQLTQASTKLATLRWVEYRVLTWLPENAFQTFMIVIAGLLGATLLKCLCLFVQESIVGEVTEKTLKDIRQDCLSHALRLDYATTSSQGTAGLMSRFTFDAQRMSEGLVLLNGRVVREPLKALACIVVALYVNWRLTLLSMLVVPVLGLTLYYVGQSIKRASRRMMESMARLYEELEETLNGLKAVIAFNRQSAHEQKFSREYDSYMTKAVKLVRYNAVVKPTSEVFSTIAVIIVMTPCAYLVMNDQTGIWGIRLASEPMDAASIAMLYGALAGLLDPCTKLTRVYSRLKQCTAAIDRIFAFLDTKSATPVPKIAASTPKINKGLEYRDLSFQYPAHPEHEDSLNPLVLNHLNLTIHAGECVAIVGENGCGKSTLLNLLPRYYEPTAGDLLVDDIPLTEIDAREFREQIGVVAQDTVLFNGSILDNIRYGRPDATDLEVEAAANASSVSQFVENLPNGLGTMVGIQGKSLSGGQRQRISLARAMIRDPKLLLLDEATSAIDAQSETAIHQALTSFVKGRTTLMVTHSITPQILEFVTRIVVIAEGRVEADGTHGRLLAESPTYQRLFSQTAPDTRAAA